MLRKLSILHPLGSIDWNRQPISYDIPSRQQARNPSARNPSAPNPSAPNPSAPNPSAPNPQAINNRSKIILLEADIDDLQSKIHEHEAVIHRLRAEICLKEDQIKRRKRQF